MDELRRWRAEQAARYLEDVRGKMLRVKSLTRAIDEQRGIAEGLQGIDYSRDLVKTSPTDATLPNAVCKLQQLLAEKEAVRSEYAQDIDCAYRAIDRMEKAEHAAALEMHYLGGESWGRCASELGYTKSGMMDLRIRALVEFFDCMPKTKVDAFR
ncbi:MAG: hypothetical protein DBX48_07585 [Limosilactobacillus fermentum]|nr:MAG: hypothetical protein DBX48_07585 [Limosilactobacillus fermentum]